MATQQELSVVVSAVNKTVGAFRDIRKDVDATTAGLGRFAGAMTALTEETGLATVGHRAEGAFEHVRHLGEGLRALAPALAGLGAAVSVAGLPS